jgi:hypothetical protein
LLASVPSQIATGVTPSVYSIWIAQDSEASSFQTDRPVMLRVVLDAGAGTIVVVVADEMATDTPPMDMLEPAKMGLGASDQSGLTLRVAAVDVTIRRMSEVELSVSITRS